MPSERVALVGGTSLVGSDLDVVDDAVIVIENGRIAAVGSSGTARVREPATTVDTTGSLLMPGFIDAHVHIGFHPPETVLANGVTTVRDLAWPPKVIHRLAERSRDSAFPGPLIVAAGPMLTAPGGYPTRAAWAPEGTGRVVDGPDDARAAVATTVEEGAAIIKVALNPEAGPTLDGDTLTAVVEAAHERGLKVTGHVAGLEELDKALDAGMDELAHMLMSDERIPDDTIARMVERGLTVVPTLSVRFGGERRTAIDNLRRFHRAGGRVIYGTDLGNAGPQPGIDGREIRAMAAAGMTVSEIVRSATVDAARWLGLESKGVLAEGADADIVAVSINGLDEPDGLTRVETVWRGGMRFP
ncbi:MAG: amidohydrolase family protein [Actinomycetota bacterium]|nr:amidohydrolase family protein [Actinomycetota bacterium]